LEPLDYKSDTLLAEGTAERYFMTKEITLPNILGHFLRM
jgi:hypothetical protein